MVKSITTQNFSAVKSITAQNFLVVKSITAQNWKLKVKNFQKQIAIGFVTLLFSTVDLNI